MEISVWAINRILEDHLAKNEADLNKFRADGRILMADMRNMSDEDILAKLSSMGLRIDKGVFGEQCINHTSANDLSHWFEKDRNVKLEGFDEDWVWQGIVVLWERWFPEIMNFEMLDDRMQKGYELLYKKQDDGRLGNNLYEALEVWGQTWEIIKDMMDKHGFNSLESFDYAFGGSQSIFNWSMDYDGALENAIFQNLEFAQTRIDFCTEYIERYEDKDEHNITEMARAIADTYFRLGNIDKGEELFKAYLKDDPAWGWAWIGWSDQFYLYDEYKDFDKAIDILRQGLEVTGLRDRDDVLDRLRDIYTDMGMGDEVENIIEEIDQAETEWQSAHLKDIDTEDFEKNVPYIVGSKTGRNDPCPCGSGKKYKKCCGK